MKNIKLGKKELLVVIIVLVLFCLYFIIDYLTSSNKNTPFSKNREDFSGQWDESKSDETGTRPVIPKILRKNMELLQEKNKDIFKKLKEINENELAFVEADIPIAERIIDKKFDIRYIVGKVKKRGGKSTINGKSMKFKEVFYDKGLSKNNVITKIEELISILRTQETLLTEDARDGEGLDTYDSLECKEQSLDDCDKGDNDKKCRLVTGIERVDDESGQVIEQLGRKKCVQRNTFVFIQLRRIFILFKELYESKLSFYHIDLGQSSGSLEDKLEFSDIVIDLDKNLTEPAYYSSGTKKDLKDSSLQDVILNHLLRRQDNESKSTKPAKTEPAMPEITYLLKESETANVNFRFRLEQIEKEINFTITEVDKDDTMYNEVKLLLIQLLKNRLDIIRKLLIKHMSFDPIETLLNLAIIGHTAVINKKNETYKTEKIKAINESKKITKELKTLIEKEKGIITKIIEFFSKENVEGELGKTQYSFSKSVQDRYFNTIKQGDSSLINFCKKIRKMDRPPNSSLMFERLANEFKEKKKSQIDRLNNNVRVLMNEMKLKDMHNEDLYKLRTNEDAQKQINAIKLAKDNINSSGKFKLNIN